MFQLGSSSQLGGGEVLEDWFVESVSLSVALSAEAADEGSGVDEEDCAV